MKFSFPRIVLAFLLTSFASLPPQTAVSQDNSAFGLVVVYPGGPNPGSSGQRVIDDFVARLSDGSGLPLTAHYFNDIAPALEHLAANPNSFVLGSTGLFLGHRNSLGLAPIASVELPDGKPEQYFLVTRKDAYSTLEDLKGKKISGSVFFEPQQFLDRVVFDGAVATGDDFDSEASSRPLSALRSLTQGEIDGVLLTAPQYHSLSALPLAGELRVVFQSNPIPSVGLMRIDNEDTAAATDRLRDALLGLAETDEGAAVAKTFGVAGFAALDDAEIENLVNLYEQER